MRYIYNIMDNKRKITNIVIHGIHKKHIIERHGNGCDKIVNTFDITK